MAGRLYQCLIHTTPFTDAVSNKTLSKKLSFNSPPPFLGSRIRYNVVRSNRRVTMTSWVNPLMTTDSFSLVGFIRERPFKSIEVMAGSDRDCKIGKRVPRIPKQVLAVLLTMSCAALMWHRCRAVYALESVPAPAPQQLSLNLKALWQIIRPKVLQVFSVFRDQGLLIVVLLGLSAFFSMAETSIMTLWPWKTRVEGVEQLGVVLEAKECEWMPRHVVHRGVLCGQLAEGRHGCWCVHVHKGSGWELCTSGVRASFIFLTLCVVRTRTG